MTTIEKYTWLVKHLAWNASQPTKKTYWVKITPEEVFELEQKYPVMNRRLLAGGTLVDEVNILDNTIVLDIRPWKK